MSERKGRGSISPDPNSGPTEFRWTRGSGEAESIFHEGSWAYCYATAQNLKDSYDSIVIRPKNNGVGEWYRLEAAQNGEDVTEDYEVDGSSLTQNLLTNLHVKKRYLDLGYPEASYAGIFSKIDLEIRKAKSNQQTYDEALTVIATYLDDPLAVEFADELFRFGEQFLHAQYVFRRTITVAERVFVENSGAFANNFTNTHRIFTEAQLRAEEDIPNDFNLPKSTIDNNQPSEFLKMPARARYTLGHARCITREYLAADSWRRLKYALKA